MMRQYERAPCTDPASAPASSASAPPCTDSPRALAPASCLSDGGIYNGGGYPVHLTLPYS